MSEEQDKLNQLSEIIDVEFLPVLDDEDFKREKVEGKEEVEIAVTPITRGIQQFETESKYHMEYKGEDVDKKATDAKPMEQEVNHQGHQTQQDAYRDTGYSSYQHGLSQEQGGYKEQVKYNEQPKNGEQVKDNEQIKDNEQNKYDNHTNKQDTSYASYNSTKKEAFRKKKKKFGAALAGGIGLTLAILLGLPFATLLGGASLFVIGMGVFFSVFAVGMGILGLGVAGFSAAAGIAPLGMLFFFGSLIAIGGGGLGCCIISLIFIGIKNLFVGGKRKLKREREEA